jgi:hypothetical protein
MSISSWHLKHFWIAWKKSFPRSSSILNQISWNICGSSHTISYNALIYTKATNINNSTKLSKLSISCWKATSILSFIASFWILEPRKIYMGTIFWNIHIFPPIVMIIPNLNLLIEIWLTISPLNQAHAIKVKFKGKLEKCFNQLGFPRNNFAQIFFCKRWNVTTSTSIDEWLQGN